MSLCSTQLSLEKETFLRGQFDFCLHYSLGIFMFGVNITSFPLQI